MLHGADAATGGSILHSQYVIFILTLCPIWVNILTMNIQLTPIRNIASSFALVVLRLLKALFFPERQSGFIEALAANGSAIHARTFAGRTPAAAHQSRTRDAFGAAIEALRQALGQPLRQTRELLKGPRDSHGAG
jgi:hypothetical protein